MFRLFQTDNKALGYIKPENLCHRIATDDWHTFKGFSDADHDGIARNLECTQHDRYNMIGLLTKVARNIRKFNKSRVAPPQLDGKSAVLQPSLEPLSSSLKSPHSHMHDTV